MYSPIRPPDAALAQRPMADADRVRDRWQSLRSALGETWVFAALEGEQWRGAVETGVVERGNGRAARLLATYYLIRGRFLPLTVTRDQRDAYFTALQHADAGDPLPLTGFVVARQRDALLRVEQRAFSADITASRGVAGIARALAEYAAARRDGGGGRDPADRFADLGRTTEVLLRQRLERALEPFDAHGFDTGAHSYGFDLTEAANTRALLAGSGLRPREQAVLGRIRFGVEVGDAAWRYGSVVLAPLASVTGDEPIGLVFEGAGTLTVFADALDEAELTAWLDAGIARWLVGYVRLL